LPQDRSDKDRLDTNLRAALNMPETMGYLRGAVVKLGQLLTCFPESIPEEFIDALSNLQFQEQQRTTASTDAQIHALNVDFLSGDSYN
jgi:predicted unusual protein kinase regulating ubiquinone biosynthesis (AarF/ABC1/UbiB family)